MARRILFVVAVLWAFLLAGQSRPGKKAAGLDFIAQKSLEPERGSPGKIAVSLWLGRDRRLAVAEREVA